MDDIKKHKDIPLKLSNITQQSLPVLLVDDEEHILLSYRATLRSAGVEHVLTINDSRQVLPLLEKKEVSLIVMDLVMPHLAGIELLSKIKFNFPHIPVIVMTALNEVEKAVECMRSGALDYLVKPVEENRFISAVMRLAELRVLGDEITSLKQHLLSDRLENEDNFSSIVTNSRKMRAVFHYIEAVSGSQKPVIITGETGVGKELIAKSIHRSSGLKGEFVGVNVAGLDDNILSDTLFGHKKGAFTGADKDRDGLVAYASGGTLFLDEIGDLNEPSQVKLLRLLEEKMYYPIGWDIPVKSSARIIASTNRDLLGMISEGKFRNDLYYRLHTHHIHIPPLRERAEDIPLLLDHFLEEASLSLKKNKPVPPRELMTLLSNYYFPGNTRELQAMVYDAVAMHKSGTISMKNFNKLVAEENLSASSGSLSSDRSDNFTFNLSGRFPTLKEAQHYLTAEALKRSNGNQGIAASLLGITRYTLNKRLIRKKNG